LRIGTLFRVYRVRIRAWSSGGQSPLWGGEWIAICPTLRRRTSLAVPSRYHGALVLTRASKRKKGHQDIGACACTRIAPDDVITQAEGCLALAPLIAGGHYPPMSTLRAEAHVSA
jgi:hypothetical protein